MRNHSDFDLGGSYKNGEKWLVSGFILRESLGDVLTDWMQSIRVKQDAKVFGLNTWKDGLATS